MQWICGLNKHDFDMAEENKTHLELYTQARERVLKGGDWLNEYLLLMQGLASAGATPTELNEIASLWAEIYREKVKEICPHYNSIKLATGDQYGKAQTMKKNKWFDNCLCIN